MAVLLRVIDIEGPTALVDAGDEVRALYTWLRDDENEWSVRFDGGNPSASELGSSVEALLVSVPPGGAAALALVLTTWIRHRRATISVAVEKDGQRLEVHARDLADVDAFVKGVRSMLEDDSD